MKKRKSALLLISVFAAMTLAACGDDPASPSSKPAPSSAAESSLASDSLGSSDAGSLPGSSADAPLSSQPGQSSSLPPASSSAPHVETDWVGKPFVGQYQGGFTTLMVNEDMTTSWDTDNTHHPAKYEIMPNGVYHIYSDDSVASDDKVDVYTDGTMAYVTHDAAEKDAFIVDKLAEYQAANAMAKKADGSLIIGSVAVGSKVKFFRVMNNVYEFNIKVEVGYGDSIEAAGAIFDVVVGSNSSTYRVVTAGSSASGAIAIIEDYTVIRSTYHGASGDLVIARNGEEIVYVTLDGQDIDLENVVVDEDGNITIKDGQRTLDNSDPSHMIWVYGATKYTLDEANHAYAAEDATSNEDVFQALDLSVTQMSAVLGSDGNLWATFTPAVGGFLSINIVVGVGFDTYGGYYDDHITIFRADAASYTSISDALVSKYGSSYLGTPSLTNFEVQAGVSYVIKVGSYYDRSKALGDTGSNFEGETLTIGYSYAAFDTATYQGSEGALVIESFNGVFRSAVLNGVALENATKVGNVITSSAVAYDFTTDPSDPKKTTTNITITIDPDNMTYEFESDSASESVFHVLTEADSGTIYSTIVGGDGNLWAVFAPASSGYLTVEETTSTSSDGFIAIYDSAATSFASANALIKADTGAALSGAGKIENFIVQAGKVYVIKAGNYWDKDKLVGDTGSSYTGNAEAIKFTFSSIMTQTFVDANGENPIVLSTENGEFRAATLNGEDIAKAEYADNGDGTVTLTALGDGVIDNSNPLDPISTSTDTVYLIDTATGTYTSSTVTASHHVIKEITATPATVSGVVEGDGNIWGKFTPSADGYLTVEETVSTGTDGYIAVYESTATSFATANALAKADSGAKLSGAGKITNLVIEAGKTYIIKAGAYKDRDALIGDTSSTFAGKSEAFKLSFEAFDTKTYTGANGDLVINKAGESIVSITLDGAVLNGASFDSDGNLFVSGAAVIDNTDRLDPKRTSTDTIYELDEAAGTYAVNVETRTRSIFHEVTSSCTVTEAVGGDGNLWLKFTAPCDGEISVEELACTAADGYLAIYPASAPAFTDNYNHQYVLDYSDKASGTLESIDDLVVSAGETYIIKAGAYADRDKVVTATNSANIGKLESLKFTFAPYDTQVYTNDNGADLTVTKKGDELLSVKSGDTELENVEIVEGAIVQDLGIILGDDGNAVHAENIYTLDEENHTYEIEKRLTALAESDAYEVAQGAPYSFVADEAAGTYTSNNGNNHSTSAIMTLTANADGAFLFHYDVESEGSGNYIWDYLAIYVNDVVLSDYSKLGGTSGMNGDVVITVHAGDVIKFEYKKDSSGNGGRDSAIISNLHFLVASSND
ncbi:MAG: hypothetical protein VZR75_02030 [Candidatus Enteromonas sp.]|nr:hypothetical protein [Candidatus Enteromonas sp.]